MSSLLPFEIIMWRKCMSIRPAAVTYSLHKNTNFFYARDIFSTTVCIILWYLLAIFPSPALLITSSFTPDYVLYFHLPQMKDVTLPLLNSFPDIIMFHQFSQKQFFGFSLKIPSYISSSSNSFLPQFSMRNDDLSLLHSSCACPNGCV